MEILATIAIGMDPDFDIGPLTLSWHGLLTFLGVAVAVALVSRWGTAGRVVGGRNIRGGGLVHYRGHCRFRLLHVIDRWDIYGHDLIRVLYFWQGGVTIYGALLGGFVGGALYIIIRNSQWYLAMWGNYFSFLGKPVRAPAAGGGTPGGHSRSSNADRPGHRKNRRHNQRGTLRQINRPTLGSGVYASDRASIACERIFGTGAHTRR